MTKPPRPVIEAVAKLHLDDDDVVLIRVNEPITTPHAETLIDYVRGVLREVGVRAAVMVLDRTMTLEIISKHKLKKQPLSDLIKSDGTLDPVDADRAD